MSASHIWLWPNSRLMTTTTTVAAAAATGQLAIWPFPMCIIGQLLSLANARFMATQILWPAVWP